MSPFDLRPIEEWDAILQRFAEETQMTACITDAAGRESHCQFERYPLCAAIHDHQQATTFICSQTNTIMLAAAKRTLKVQVDQCDAALLRVVVPIVRRGALVGQVTACGLAADDEEPESFLIAKQLGISEDRVMELASSTPQGSMEELRGAAERLFEELNP